MGESRVGMKNEILKLKVFSTKIKLNSVRGRGGLGVGRGEVGREF